jgi:hypothetical protein
MEVLTRLMLWLYSKWVLDYSSHNKVHAIRYFFFVIFFVNNTRLVLTILLRLLVFLVIRICRMFFCLILTTLEH